MNISQSLSAEVRALADLFGAAPIGGTVTFAAMTAALGQPIQARRYLAVRALHVCTRESGAIFGSVRSVGYQRIEPKNAHILGSHTRGRIRRASKRTADAIVAAITSTNDISDIDQRKAWAEVNSLSLIRHIATDKQVSAASAEPKAEPLAIVMRRFAQQIGAIE